MKSPTICCDFLTQAPLLLLSDSFGLKFQNSVFFSHYCGRLLWTAACVCSQLFWCRDHSQYGFEMSPPPSGRWYCHSFDAKVMARWVKERWWKIRKSRVMEAFSQRWCEKTVDSEEFSIWDTLRCSTTHDDTQRYTMIHDDTQRHTMTQYDTVQYTTWQLEDGSWFSVSWLKGEGPLCPVLDLWQSDWPVLESHSGRTEKKCVHVVLKVKSASRLEHRVERNYSSEAPSKTRGQMRTWPWFSSSTICCLQTGSGGGIWSKMWGQHSIWIVNASPLSCPVC